MGRAVSHEQSLFPNADGHLAAALTLVALLVYLTVRAGYPAKIGGRGASQRFMPMNG